MQLFIIYYKSIVMKKKNLIIIPRLGTPILKVKPTSLQFKRRSYFSYHP